MEQEKTHNLIEVLQFCREHKLPARVVGKWVWIKYPAKPKPSTLELLKEIGFRWSPRRRQWAHNCGHPSQPAENYAPWDRYKTQTLEEAFPTSR